MNRHESQAVNELLRKVNEMRLDLVRAQERILSVVHGEIDDPALIRKDFMALIPSAQGIRFLQSDFHRWEDEYQQRGNNAT